jgi:hypothetical protein
MTRKEQVRDLSKTKSSDLERLMREFGCTNNEVAEYPINDPEACLRIGKLISAAVQSVCGQYRRALANRMFDSYRPELHYMRGPGPRSRKKQDVS